MIGIFLKLLIDKKENEMKTILILEDDFERMIVFDNLLNKLNWDYIHVDTAKEAIKEIDKIISKEITVDEIWLDHDLGGEESQMSPSIENTGYEVAKYIGSKIKISETLRNIPVIIHSYNAPGAMNMLKVLGDNARYIPFNILCEYLRKLA